MPENKRGISDKMRGQIAHKIRLKRVGSKAKTIKVRYIVAMIAIVGAAMLPKQIVQAAGCPDLRVMFARGSGASRLPGSRRRNR